MRAYNKQSFKYIALNKQFEELQDISAYVEDGGLIEYNSLTRLKASCTIPVSLSINEKLNLDAIRIYEVLNSEETCLGTFLISTPRSSFDDSIQSIECTGYSTLWRISNNTPSNRYYVSKETNCIAEVKRILTGLGYAFYIADSEGTTSTNREWPIGTSYLDIINDLLKVVNYTSLFVDVMGNYIAEPYVLPQDREVGLILDEDDIDNSIEPVQSNELDLFNVPNKFIRYCSSDPTVSLYAVYENTDGITGTSNTWVNTDVQEVQDVANYDTLYALCKRDCASAISIYNKVQVTTAIQMIPTYMATIQLNHYQAEGKYSCTSFAITLEVGGSQEMNLRKAVILL